MLDSLIAYIAMDRRHAIAQGRTLPEQTEGAALFADISGFTPLTETLVMELGPQRGAEELTVYLNQVYDALIEKLHHWGGSVIAFAGDAVTCWFDGHAGLRATACALAMQDAMQAFSTIQTPAGSTIQLTMKAAVAIGPAKRFLVGDPSIRVIDAVAGATLERLAAGEHHADKGEVVLAPCALFSLSSAVDVRQVRRDAAGSEYGVVDRLRVDVEPKPWPALPQNALNEEQVREWLLPPVYRSLKSGQGQFLAELRPTVAIFLKFSGIDYDLESDAGAKLDSYIRWVQSVVYRYEGTLVDLNIGDKGSYLYINFGAPLSHEDNAVRAATTALELRDPPEEFDFLDPVHIGITMGRMRAGAYGGSAHRSYGVLGDAVNLSARLMMASKPGTILASLQIEKQTDKLFEWEILAPIRVKGKTEPVPVAVLKGTRPRIGMHLPETDSSEPIIGRDNEIALLRKAVDGANSGQGRVVGLAGEAGLGKSRLVAALINVAKEQGFVVFGGECESHRTNSSYLVWHPIWRNLLGVDPALDKMAQESLLLDKLSEIDESLIPRMPLLGPALQLTITHNATTDGLEAKLRKSLLETMLLEILSVQAARQPILLVLEDCHWLDDLSRDLLEVIVGGIVNLPVLIVATYRNLAAARLGEETVSARLRFEEIMLTPLSENEMALLAEVRLHRLSNSRDSKTAKILARRIAQQADGNPFFLEELVNFVGNEAAVTSDPNELTMLSLPSSLRGLVLSRLDQLDERPKTVLKVASVVGRVFRATWLEGVYPELGSLEEVNDDLQMLTAQDFTVYDPIEGEDSYYFRNVVTRGVIYDSILHQTRANLHEQTGMFLENAYDSAQDEFLELLAYHFEHSQNEAKKRFYLRRAGEFAQKSYANQVALDYYRKLLPLLPLDDQIQVLLNVGEVEKLVGNWAEAAEVFERALSLARSMGDQSVVGWSETAIGEMNRMQGKYVQAYECFDRAKIAFENSDDRQGLAQVLHYTGNVAGQQADIDRAEALYEQSLDLRRAMGDEVGVASLLNNLAIIAEYRGNLEQSRDLHKEALAIRRGLGDRRTIAFSLSNLGHILLQLDDYEAARSRLEEAVALHRQVGDRWYLATTLNNLGNAIRLQKKYAEASDLYAEGLDIIETLGDGWATAFLLEDIAQLLYLQEQSAEAVVTLSAAEKLREDINAPLPAGDQRTIEELTLEMRSQLGATNFDELSRTGSEMSMEAAIQFARSRLGAHNPLHENN